MFVVVITRWVGRFSRFVRWLVCGYRGVRGVWSTRECICSNSLKEWKGAHFARCGEEQKERADARAKMRHCDLGPREIVWTYPRPR